MSIKSADFIHQSQRVHVSVQNIAEELNRSPTTQKKFHILTRKLDATLKILNTIKEQSPDALFSKIATEAMEKEIVSLYGRVIDAWVKNEVTQIHRQSVAIELCLKRGKVSKQAVIKLACHLHSFKKDHRPSLQERRILAKAEQVLSRAHAFLQKATETKKGNPTSSEKKIGNPTDQDWELVSSCGEEKFAFQPLAFCEEISSITADQIEDLMDISSLIYNSDIRQAKIKYNQLQEEHKKRFLLLIHLKAYKRL
jgi:hypothetical protein